MPKDNDTKTLARDPVCGMQVDPANAAGQTEYEGQTIYFCNVGCLKKFESDPKRYTAPEQASDVSALHHDVVCGMKIKAENAAGMVEHNGHTHYFCSNSCVQKFKADPERYLRPKSNLVTLSAAPLSIAPAPSVGATSAQGNVEYTCPMDPEVRQIGPGSCPKCGMALEPVSVSAHEDANPELESMTRRLWISVALTAPILLFMISEMLPGQPLQVALGPGALLWTQLLLATPVVLWGGWPFFQRGWSSVVNRHLNMFTLIALGTGAAYGYSVAATLWPNLFPASMRDHHTGALPVYFEPAAVIVTLVLLGQVLELRARSQTSAALRALLSLAPNTARILLANGREEDIDIDRVKLGDRIRVRPGERVPLDGFVVDGTTSIDESMITGEPVPVEKQRDSQVIGGTLNGTGSIVMQANRVGADTLLSQIVRMVGEAQRSRAPIQRLADRVSGYFVPAVIAVAILTAFLWGMYGPEPSLAHALVNAVAVLIIACPCALGLATPMSIMVGTGRGAQAGVLIRNAEALELLEKIDTLVVDKTGTLTEGKPKLVTLRALEGIDDRDLLRLTASLEQASEHPLAESFVRAAHERGVVLGRVEQFVSQTGKGVQGLVDGRQVRIGNEAFMSGMKLQLGILPTEADELRRDGQTVMFVAIDGKLAGLVGVADPVKPGASDAVRALTAAGIRVVMLTGDNRTTAEAVARRLGITEVHADVLPDQKAAAVKTLQWGGHKVAMAGDGINDAPALAQAEVGIAMGTGTDVAMESAGVTLVRGDLRGIMRARKLSRATMQNVRQNLFFAFVYNAVGVPIAAGALYPLFGLVLSPMLASAAMTFSSVSVILNALRLRRIEL